MTSAPQEEMLPLRSIRFITHPKEHPFVVDFKEVKMVTLYSCTLSRGFYYVTVQKWQMKSKPTFTEPKCLCDSSLQRLSGSCYRSQHPNRLLYQIFCLYSRKLFHIYYLIL